MSLLLAAMSENERSAYEDQLLTTNVSIAFGLTCLTKCAIVALKQRKFFQRRM